MADAHHSHDSHASDAEHGAEGHAHHPDYVKIWAVLVVLLVISVVGPMFGVRVVTLLTAFGIAVVKAYLVARNFMHINVARRYVTYLVVTCLVFMLLFFSAVAPDVMKDSGTNWSKTAEWHTAHSAGPAGHGGEQH
jgi:caa(3)-type oxidase subunit IV